MTARLLAAALSCMSLLLVCWLGRRCFGEWAALLATFFTAVAPVVVQQAHFLTVDGVFLLCSLVCFCVLAKAYPDWRPVDLVRTWIYARGGDEAAEIAAVTRYRAGFFDVEDAHYGPWASALSFVLAEMPDLALTALGEGALQVAEHQTPAGVRRAMVDSYGEIARLLEERGKEGHAQVARRLAGDMAQ